MAVLEERGGVSTGGSGVALAWLADREPSPDWSGLWPAGGGPAGPPGGLDGPAPGHLLRHIERPGEVGPGCAVGAGGVSSGGFWLKVCMVAGVGRGSAASLAWAGVVRRSPRRWCARAPRCGRGHRWPRPRRSRWGTTCSGGTASGPFERGPDAGPPGDRRPERGRPVGARPHRDPQVVNRSERCRRGSRSRHRGPGPRSRCPARATPRSPRFQR